MSSFFQDSRILSDLQNSPLISEALDRSVIVGGVPGGGDGDKVNIQTHAQKYSIIMYAFNPVL